MSRSYKHVQYAGRAGVLIAIAWLVCACAGVPLPSGGSTPPAAASTVDASGSAVDNPASTATNASKKSDGSVSAPNPGPAVASAESAPSPPAPPKPPVPASEPTALSAAQISHDIAADGAKGFWPLMRGPRVLHLIRKVAPTGGPEVFAVFARVESPADAQVSTLSDFSRLFKHDLKPVTFSLVQFTESGGRLHETHAYRLGDYLVFESMKIVPIKKGADMPFAVSVTFQTQEGSNDEWVTFSKEGTSQISLQRTLSRSPIIEDINNNGYLDIVIRERGIEEGTGYETFLTWYKWDGRAFKEYKTTNIVRNLREFLGQAATLLAEDRLVQFYQSSLSPSEFSRLRGEGLDDKAIFSKVFRLVPSSPDNPNDPIEDLAAIHQVIFPNIFENPFTEQDRRGYAFPMTVRFVTSDDASHFYAAKIYMHRNPFVEPEFNFALESVKDPE